MPLQAELLEFKMFACRPHTMTICNMMRWMVAYGLFVYLKGDYLPIGCRLGQKPNPPKVGPSFCVDSLYICTLRERSPEKKKQSSPEFHFDGGVLRQCMASTLVFWRNWASCNMSFGKGICPMCVMCTCLLHRSICSTALCPSWLSGRGSAVHLKLDAGCASEASPP